MARLFSMMVLGAVLGAGIVWWLSSAGSTVVGVYDAPDQATPDAGAAAAGSAAPGTAGTAAAVPVADGAARSSEQAATQGAVAPVSPLGIEVAPWLDPYVRQAERDPAGAVRSALELDHYWERRLVLMRLGGAAALHDPAAALAAASALEDFRLVTAFKIGLFAAWPDVAPEAAFAWLERASPAELLVNERMFESFAASDPARLLDIAREFPPQLKRVAQRAAFASLAARDPYAALTMLDTLTSGTSWAAADRPAHVQTIAQSIAYSDPDAALRLAATLPPSDRAAVVAGVANANVLAAADYVIAQIAGMPDGTDELMPSVLQVMNRAFQSSSDTVTLIIDRLAQLDNRLVAAALGGVVSQWAAYDSERALSWALAHPDDVRPDSFARLATRVGRADAQLAAAALARVPAELQSVWIRSVATGIALNDFDGGMRWLARIEGSPEYDAAVRDLLRNTLGLGTRTLPGQAEAIARFLDGAPPGTRAELAPSAAAALAVNDPAAAAAWVAGLELDDDGEAQRLQAIESVALVWSRSDALAATEWALDLPRGEQRDRALGSFLTSVAPGTPIDERVFAAFASADARDAAVAAHAVGVADFDAARARRLVETYVADAELRRRTQARIDGRP